METWWRRRCLGFVRKRYENPSFLFAKIVVPTRIGLNMGYGGCGPKMGHVGASPCSAGHGWAPMGPSFFRSTSWAKYILILVGPTAYLAYMALN